MTTLKKDTDQSQPPCDPINTDPKWAPTVEHLGIAAGCVLASTPWAGTPLRADTDHPLVKLMKRETVYVQMPMEGDTIHF